MFLHRRKRVFMETGGRESARGHQRGDANGKSQRRKICKILGGKEEPMIVEEQCARIVAYLAFKIESSLERCHRVVCALIRFNITITQTPLISRQTLSTNSTHGGNHRRGQSRRKPRGARREPTIIENPTFGDSHSLVVVHQGGHHRRRRRPKTN